jgi:hypothetical protein
MGRNPQGNGFLLPALGFTFRDRAVCSECGGRQCRPPDGIPARKADIQ